MTAIITSAMIDDFLTTNGGHHADEMLQGLDGSFWEVKTAKEWAIDFLRENPNNEDDTEYDWLFFEFGIVKTTMPPGKHKVEYMELQLDENGDFRDY